MTYELELLINPASDASLTYEAIVAWLESRGIHEYAESTWNHGGGASVSLLVYRNLESEAESTAQDLHAAFGKAITMNLRQLPDATWRDSWQADFAGLVTDRFVLCLEGADPKKLPGHVVANKFVIMLRDTPSFGRGDHATTEAMLRLMEKHLPLTAASNSDFLDVGTGNGVLTIAADRLGLNRLIATEIEQEIIDDAIANLAHNRVKAEVLLIDHTQHLGMFAVVASNILSGALYDLLPQLQQNLRPGGKMFLSGFIEKELPMFRQRLEDLDLKEVDHCIVRGWVALCAHGS